jgi:hypothetical protein
VANDGADFSIDAAALTRDGDLVVRRHLTAGVRTVARVTRTTEQKLEAATQSAVPGQLFRAWKSSTFPKKAGPARNPAGTIWLNGGAQTRAAIEFWTQPGTIRGRQGQYLAIPLPAAGMKPGNGRGRDGRPTPVEWEALHNQELIFVARPGRAALLVAENAVLSGRRQIAKPNTPGRIAKGRGSATVPIFVLMPVVQHRNAFAIKPVIDASEGELAQAFLLAVRELGRG